MKWRAWVRVVEGAVVDVLNQTGTDDIDWERCIKEEGSPHVSQFGGHWCAVEIEDGEFV